MKRKRDSLSTVPFLKYTIIYKTTIFYLVMKAYQKFSSLKILYDTANIYIIFLKTNIFCKKISLFLKKICEFRSLCCILVVFCHGKVRFRKVPRSLRNSRD